jgi:AcrR family transcriptional regulator
MSVKSKSRPRAPLSRDRIVELAIEHADERGIEQVSMRRLAAELSVTPMALYWHFANRDALLDAMAEHVATEVAHDDDPDALWQARLRRALMTTLTLFQSHPWLGPLGLERIVPAPGYLRALEVLLDTVRTAGYGPRATVDVVEFAIESVSAMAARTAEVAKNPQDPSQDQLAMRQQFLNLSRVDYPHIRDAAKPLTSPGKPGSYVKNGIDVLIGGIEAAAPTRSASTPRG